MGRLQERFLVPPFSVLDTRQGYWQERKRQWIQLGIKSEVGRGHVVNEKGHSLSESQDRINKFGVTSGSPMPIERGYTIPGKSKFKVVNPHLDEKTQRTLGVIKVYGDSTVDRCGGTSLAATSIFDPVLCELMCKWFCPESGSILDPFAGGSVRGIVAEKLGYNYTGIELRGEQIESNIIQAKNIGVNPKWIVGDSKNIDRLVNDKHDFVFSCPPYYDLEIYSELEGELSAFGCYEEFLEEYQVIISKSVNKLKDNRFACFVVSSIRDKKGFYRNFVFDTIVAFEKAGMKLYNDAILINAIGSLPIRVGKQFEHYRKLGKTHQNILIFYKGNPKDIKEEFGDIKLQKSLGIIDKWTNVPKPVKETKEKQVEDEIDWNV